MIRTPRASCAATIIALSVMCSVACGSSGSGTTSNAAGASGSSVQGGSSGMIAGAAGTSVALGGAGAGGAVGSAAAGMGGSSAGVGGNAGSSGSSGSAGASGSSANAGAFSVAGAGSFVAWPGGNAVAIVDPANTYASDLSGLQYEPAQGTTPAVLWAVQNGPSKLYRLLYDGTNWVSDGSSGWGSGKTLHFPNGTGTPDSEAVTKLAFGTSTLYVSTERDSQDPNVSRLSVLSFDGSSADSTLNATHEWNLTGDQPTVGPNLGLEGLTWIPDAYLTSKGFLDESTKATYDPAHYANHAGGIFFVGVEQTGMIYGYALDHVTPAQRPPRAASSWCVRASSVRARCRT